jgi:hypothetical protein
MAGLLLTALAATLALLAQPSAAASLDSYDIEASVRYGCAQNDGEDNFVEVTLSAGDWQGGGDQAAQDGADHALVLQVGLAGPESADSDGVFPEGGPSLVTLGDTPTKVRLAGPVHDDDHVFLRQLDQSDVITLPLQSTCHRIKPTNFGLDEPSMQVTPQSCTTGSQANLKVVLDNPNDVDQRLQNIGIDQIDYTVLLVRHDGLLAGADPVGTLISFDEPSASVITLSQVVAKPATYQVRVIGQDGAVVSSNSIRLSCAGTVPAPSSSLSPTRPTPTVPPSRPGSATPSTSRPAPSTSRPAPSSPAPSSPAPSSPVPSSPASSRSVTSSVSPTSAPSSSAPTGPASSVRAGPTTSAVLPPPLDSSAAPSGGSSSSPRPIPTPVSTSAATPSAPASTSSAAGPVVSSPAPSPEPSRIRLVEPRSNYGPLPVFQKEVALVVLVFSVALAALVGGTLVAARRR